MIIGSWTSNIYPMGVQEEDWGVRKYYRWSKVVVHRGFRGWLCRLGVGIRLITN